MNMYHAGKERRSGVFDPNDAEKVMHIRLGAWDLYEERASFTSQLYLPGWSWALVKPGSQLWNDLPFLWTALKDLSHIPSCWTLLLADAVLLMLNALIPALSIWYSSRLVEVVQSAVEHRSIDGFLLFQAAGGRFACSAGAFFLRDVQAIAVRRQLADKIKQHYETRIFHANIRLDLPTSQNPAIQSKLRSADPSPHSFAAYEALGAGMGIASIAVQFLSQFSILVHILSNQRDGLLLSALVILNSQLELLQRIAQFKVTNAGTWAATTTNKYLLLAAGLSTTAHGAQYRQEIVAGNMWRHMLSLFQACSESLGPHNEDFKSAHTRFLDSRMSIAYYFFALFDNVPQIVFSLRALQYPESIPVSLVSLNLITDSSRAFMQCLNQVSGHIQYLSMALASLRNLYELPDISNLIPDGTLPYPENRGRDPGGMAVEFRNVSFKYAGSEADALHNVSFKILSGQLCVIVGMNGSGKSTVLKLIARIYEPYEGQILIDDIDIRTLKLEDLRDAMSIMFQEYNHMPFTIGENIGFGNPGHFSDEEKLRKAAELGGALEFIEKLPDGFNTYLSRPVHDHISGMPKGTKTLFGRPVPDTESTTIFRNAEKKSLSGGQMQRLALSRTFMRSIGDDDSISLLMFDEPSASLDPEAEHELFQRLRKLRGRKTMLFSSHRFGNLTRHADIILYMSDSSVVETGTHDELVRLQGKYANIWNLQAQSFLS